MLAGSRTAHWFLHWPFVERVRCGSVLGIEMTFYYCRACRKTWAPTSVERSGDRHPHLNGDQKI
jgi:hypothetical protein